MIFVVGSVARKHIVLPAACVISYVLVWLWGIERIYFMSTLTPFDVIVTFFLSICTGSNLPVCMNSDLQCCSSFHINRLWNNGVKKLTQSLKEEYAETINSFAAKAEELFECKFV